MCAATVRSMARRWRLLSPRATRVAASHSRWVRRLEGERDSGAVAVRSGDNELARRQLGSSLITPAVETRQHYRAHSTKDEGRSVACDRSWLGRRAVQRLQSVAGWPIGAAPVMRYDYQIDRLNSESIPEPDRSSGV
jgi:hypothetical protein